MKKIIFLIAAVIILTNLAVAQAQAPRLPTPQIPGCEPFLNLTAPSAINISTENETTVQVKVTNVRCIASHVYVFIEEIRPAIEYSLAPDFYPGVEPNKTVQFNITFAAAKNLENKTYTGIYWIRTTSKWINSGEVKIRPVSPEEKAKEIITVQQSVSGQNKTENITEKPAVQKIGLSFRILLFLFIIGLFAGILFFREKKV